MKISSDELLRRHPTIESLEQKFEGLMEHECGLVSQGSEIKFGKAELGWELEISMTEIYKYARETLGEYDPSDTRVIVGLLVIGRIFDVGVVNNNTIEVETYKYKRVFETGKRKKISINEDAFNHFKSRVWTVH